MILLLAVQAKADSNDWVSQYPELCTSQTTEKIPQVVRIKIEFSQKVTQGGVTLRVKVAMRCSGVVVGNTQVLTSRHCLEPRDPADETKLLVGDLERVVVTSGDLERVVVFHTPSDTADLSLLEIDSTLGIEPLKIVRDIPIALTLVGYGCSDTTAPLQRSAVKLFAFGQLIGIGGCICHGDSGGAVLDDEGNLLGIMAQTFEDGKRGRAVRAAPFMTTLGLMP